MTDQEEAPTFRYMEILGVILIGLAVGIVAKLLMARRRIRGELSLRLCLESRGAFFWPNSFGQQLGWYGERDAVASSPRGGTIVLLLLYRLLFARRRRVIIGPPFARLGVLR
jgi:uncharacterized membrane protein YeaQ/YmgE (transglycosylase-associated protein family)